jgi:hypothetical protein
LFKIYCLWVGEGKTLMLYLNVVNINYIGGDVLQVMLKMISLVKTFFPSTLIIEWLTNNSLDEV